MKTGIVWDIQRVVLLLLALLLAMVIEQGKLAANEEFPTEEESQYKNTVYLPYYRLPRDTGSSSYQLDHASEVENPFDLRGYDPEPFLPYSEKYAAREVPAFEEYLLAGLASSRITQVNYFRLLPSKGGTGELDFAGFYPEHMAYLQKLRRIYAFRLVICIAGGSSRYLPIVKNAALRSKLAQNIVAFAKTWGLDGVDFDWEYPRSQAHTAAYIALIEEVQSGLRRGYTAAEASWYRVSVAISRLQAALDTKLFQAVDEVNFMSYDFALRHSTIEDAQEMVDYLSVRFAIPSQKIFLGLPFYGREIKTGRRKARTYRSLAEDFDLASDENEVGNYYFNGQDMVQDKFDFAQRKDLGGIMIWEIGQDSEDHRSLLRILPRQK